MLNSRKWYNYFIGFFFSTVCLLYYLSEFHWEISIIKFYFRLYMTRGSFVEVKGLKRAISVIERM